MTDKEWTLIEPLMPARCRRGRPREINLRRIIDAILYVAAPGCQWRALPKDFSPYSTVQYYFYKWRGSGLWRAINSALVRRMRERQGRKPIPSVGIIDSQSVKSTESGGPRGFDMAKKVKGRKRHIVTDSEGSLLAVLVQAANVQDNHGAVPLLQLIGRMFPNLRHILADRVYSGSKLLDALADLGRWTIEIVTRSQSVGTFSQNLDAGLSSALSHGSAATAASPKISRHPLPAPKLGFSSPACGSSLVAWPDHDITGTYFESDSEVRAVRRASEDLSLSVVGGR